MFDWISVPLVYTQVLYTSVRGFKNWSGAGVVCT